MPADADTDADADSDADADVIGIMTYEKLRH